MEKDGGPGGQRPCNRAPFSSDRCTHVISAGQQITTVYCHHQISDAGGLSVLTKHAGILFFFSFSSYLVHGLRTLQGKGIVPLLNYVVLGSATVCRTCSLRIKWGKGCRDGQKFQSMPPPHITLQLSNLCNISSKGFNALFWLLWAPIMHMVHRHTYRQNSDTYKIEGGSVG